MLLPKFGRSAKAVERLVESPDDIVVLDELPRCGTTKISVVIGVFAQEEDAGSEKTALLHRSPRWRW